MQVLRTMLAPAALAAAGLLTAGVATAGTQQATEPSLRVSENGSSTQLSLGSATAFHRTSARVQDARAIALPGGGALAVTWTEVDATGLARPWYAISLDGSSFATVQPTSYTIHMDQARFDPLVELPDFSASGLAWDGEMYLVQFVTQVLEGYPEALTALGATTYDHIVNHTLVVRMSPAVRAQVQALEFVRWVGPFHPELRLEPEILTALAEGALALDQVYNVAVFERGPEQKALVADRIAALGGEPTGVHPDGFLFQARLTPDQLVAVIAMPEVASLDRWGPGGPDMNIVRQFGGADYLESQTAFTGQGVRGESFDTGCNINHADFQHDGGFIWHGASSTDSHGTATAGICFGNGAGNATARGLLPNGNGVVGYSIPHLGNSSRYAYTAELVNPSLPYKCVFQTNSTGSPQTSSYTSVSQMMDDILFINDIVILQSQSNLNSTASRPEAWAKNMVSCGGINHQGTLTKADDSWGGASIGPATDGRIKPDMASFYDQIFTTSWPSAYTSSFGGTSGATPIVAGHFGLFFQMWHNNVWNNGATGATVFESRPSARLARAAVINTAQQWTFSGTNHNLTRTHQGWGAPDVKKLYDTRNNTFWVDESEVLNNLATKTYNLTVAAGAPELKATLVYRDPKAVNFTGVHRINDLTLRVTSPGGTVYWGNNGLNAGNWSTAGGSANTVDVVENVFVQNPQSGSWTVEVIGSDINTDIVPSVPGNNADFALWVTGVAAQPCTSPIAYCTAKQTSQGGTPVIGSTGTPSSATQNFVITLNGAIGGSTAVCFSGTASNNTPFSGGGFLCVGGNIVRELTTLTSAGGGTSFPVNIQGSMVGTTLYYQWWFRDPAQTPNPIGLTAGLEVTYCNS